jgi:hypothetical protein
MGVLLEPHAAANSFKNEYQQIANGLAKIFPARSWLKQKGRRITTISAGHFARPTITA